MAVAVRGVVGSYAHWATATVTWPAGSAVGDLAVLYLSENKSGNPSSKPDASGWKLVASGYAETVWQKVLTAPDIAAGLPIIGYLYELCVFSGASKVGRITSSAGVSCVAGAAALFFGWETNERVGQMTPLTEKLFASDIINDSYNYRPNNAWFRLSPTASYVSWVSSADHEISVEILPLAAPPAPVPVSPSTGTQVNPGVVNVFEWEHQSTRAQAEYRLRLREVATTPWYWVTAAGALTLTDTGVASQSPSASLAAGALTTAKTYEWQVATSDGGLLGPYSASWQVSAVAPPVVTGITVTSPAGDLTPRVAHTATFGVGAQQAYHLRLSTSATDSGVGVVYDSGVVSSASASNEVPVQDWVNGQNQYAWLRVQQSGGMWSGWTRDDVTHKVSWTPPSVPTLALSGGTPGVPVTVTVSDVVPGNVAQVEAQVAGGAWRRVAEVEVPPSSRVNLVPNPTLDNLTGWNAPQGGTATFYNEADYQGKFHTLGQARGGFVAVTASGSATTVGLSIPRIAVPGGVTKVTIGAWAEADAPLEFQIQANLLTSGVSVYPKSSVVDMTDSTYSGVRHVWTFDLPAGTTECGLSLYARNPGLVGNVGAGKRLWLDSVTMEWGTTDGSWLQTISVEDPLAAYGVVTTYRARRQALVSTTPMWSSWSYSSTRTNLDTKSYLVGDDGTWIAVRVREDGDRSLEQGVSVWYGMGASRPRIDLTERQGEAGTLKFNLPTQADRVALLAWLDKRSVWTTRWNPEHDDAGVFVDVPPTRMGPASRLYTSRFEQQPYQRREIELDWVEQ